MNAIQPQPPPTYSLPPSPSLEDTWAYRLRSSWSSLRRLAEGFGLYSQNPLIQKTITGRGFFQSPRRKGGVEIKGGKKGAETKITRPLIFHQVKGMKRNRLKYHSSLAPQACCPLLTSKARKRSWLILLAQSQAAVDYCFSGIFLCF